jgi:DNA adenine methylase
MTLSEHGKIYLYFFEGSFMRDIIQPFLPCIGGKRAIADQIISYIPLEKNTYYEPFLRGGALYFRVKDGFRKHVLSDINLRLTTSYNAVKKKPEAVITKLQEHKEKDSKTYYQQLQNSYDEND